MNEVRVLTYDKVFLRMIEHIIGNFPDDTVVWDADSVSEREFNSTIPSGNYNKSSNNPIIISVSFDSRLLEIIKDKYPKIIVIHRPFSLFLFENMFENTHDFQEHQHRNLLPKLDDNTKKSGFSSLYVDPDNMAVQIGLNRKQKTVFLTPKEFALFNILYSNRGKNISKTEITARLNHSFHDENSSFTDISANSETGNVVEVYIHYLRKKLGKNIISSVRGKGYRMEL